MLTYFLVVLISGCCWIFFVNSRQFYLNKCSKLKQHFLHVWHGSDHTIIENAIDKWRERLHACVQAKGRHFEQLLWLYSAIWQKTFQLFDKCDTIFRLIFWKSTQIRTSNFRKVLRQRTEGMVGSIIWVLLEIYLRFQRCKSFKNPLRIDKVIAMSLVY